MKIGFIDYSHEERNKILSTLKKLGDQTALDELGIGVVRDAYADILFPGISTLQTRAKYLVLVPYLFQSAKAQAEKGKIHSGRELLQWINEAEDRLAATLTNNCPPSEVGIVGSNAYRNKRSVKVKPSAIYWTALRTFGIFRGENMYLSAACKLLYAAARRRAETANQTGDDSFDDPTAKDQGSALFLPIVPDYDYEKNATMDLTEKEAQFLYECILRSPFSSGSLLAFFIKNKMVCDDFKSVPVDLLPDELRRDYRLAKDFSRFIYGAHISSFGDVENCIGVFVYGHIPFSFVTRVIFENEENKERFVKPGAELWFPEEIFSTWADEPYASMAKRTINTDSLRTASSNLDELLDPDKQSALRACLLKQMHAKVASYLAIEATKGWQIKTVKSNVDSAVIELLDAGTGAYRRQAEEKLDSLSKIFQFVNPCAFKQRDSALEDPLSEGHRILCAIFEEIAQNDYRLDKETIRRIKEHLEQELGTDIIGFSDLAGKLDAICTFANSRLGNAEEMLSATKGNDVLYALAICVKNKGKIEHVKLETVEMSQSVRRYTYIIAGLVASMADINGSVKCNRALEKNLSDVCAIRFVDDEVALIVPMPFAQESFGIVPEVHISVTELEFKNHLETSDDSSLEALYKSEFASPDLEKEVFSYKIPISIIMDGKEYVIDTPDSINEFKKEFERKLTRKKTELNKNLFLSWIFKNETGRKRIREVFEKFRGIAQ